MRTVASTATSPAVLALMTGPKQEGVALGHGHLLFGTYVVSITAPGRSRMPNGVEAEVLTTAGAPAVIGEGRLTVGRTTVLPGPEWDPRPQPRIALSLDPDFLPDAQQLCGWGPGRTALGDDILVGYVAATVLYGDQPARPRAWPTTWLGQTLLRHAEQGELPGAAHRLLRYGDASGLVRFGSTSGRGLLLGLAAGAPCGAAAAGDHRAPIPVFLTLPDGARSFQIRVHELAVPVLTTPGGGARPAATPTARSNEEA